MMSLTLTTGDTRPALTGQALDGTTPANLTGATGALHIRRNDGTVLNVAAAWVTPDEGRWSYTWQAGDLNVAGTWTVELQVTYADTGIQTFGPVSFTVRDQIA